MTKNEARAVVKKLRAGMAESELILKSRNVIEKLKQLEEFINADNIFVYVSYNNEVDTKEFIADCLELGKNVFVPKVNGREMRFHKIYSLDELHVGSFGILEPANDYLDQWNDLSGFMVMPGVAFDKKLNRVGYGGGYYDRYLSSHLNIKKAAVCFDFQLVDNIEAEEHDLKPDILVSENYIIF